MSTMRIVKYYFISLSGKPLVTYCSREDVASIMRLAKEADVKLDIRTAWSMQRGGQ